MLARRHALGGGALVLPSPGRAQGCGPDGWLLLSLVSAYRTSRPIQFWLLPCLPMLELPRDEISVWQFGLLESATSQWESHR